MQVSYMPNMEHTQRVNAPLLAKLEKVLLIIY
jgi:hypothetical protein